MAKKEYTPLNLPKALVEELKIWRMAFCSSYGRTVSYGEMIRGMLDSLEDTDPGVVEELDRMVEKHPGLLDKLGEYRRENEPDIHGGVLGLSDDIDPKLLSMAGTISMPTPEELEADPRLKEAFGKS